MITTALQKRRDCIAFGPQILLPHKRQRHHPDVLRAETRFGPIYYRPGTTDLPIFRNVFMGGDYDYAGLPQHVVIQAQYEEILDRGKTPVIIDAGANVGAAAMWFANLYPKAAIICVEPDPDNVRILRLNTTRLKQVLVAEAAIGATAGTIQLIRAPGGACAVQTVRSQTGIPVETVDSLPARVVGGELLLVKVDIEGFEADLFAHQTEWVQRAAAVIVEPHDWMKPASSRSLQRVMFNRNRDLLILGHENLMFVRSSAP